MRSLNTISRRFILAALISMALTSTVAATSASACDEEEPFVTLNRLLLADAIEAREPIAHIGDVGANGDRVYLFMDARNPSGPDTTLTVTWTFDGDATREVTQIVEVGPSPRWRTWVAKRFFARDVGVWHVEVFDENDTFVDMVSFQVVAESPSEASPLQAVNR